MNTIGLVEMKHYKTPNTEYDVPIPDYNQYFWQFTTDEVLFHSKNKKDLYIKIDANKYNL